MIWLAAVALSFLVIGWLALRRASLLRRRAGLPGGRLIYADSHHQDWQSVSDPYFSATYGLIGKPDYVVETGRGLIPVEVKSGKTPQVPYMGHILQVAAYCLLIEETTGQRSPHGLLKYADALYEIDFTGDLRAELLDTMAAMRQDRLADDVARSHNQPGKCAACAFLDVCEDALSQPN